MVTTPKIETLAVFFKELEETGEFHIRKKMFPRAVVRNHYDYDDDDTIKILDDRR